jgi:hypothetical protein
MKISHILLICCLLTASIAILLDEQPNEMLAQESVSRDTHGGDMSTQGHFEVIILEDEQDSSPIKWNSDAEVYDLSYPAERLRVIISASDLELNRTFAINWQVFGILDNDATNISQHDNTIVALSDTSETGEEAFSGRIVVSTKTGNSGFNSSILSSELQNGGFRMDAGPSSSSGCYWITATISDAVVHTTELMNTAVSESVRYGSSCPNEVQPGLLKLDSDRDGWTDELERACGADPFDLNNSPTTTRMSTSVCEALGDDDNDGVRNMNDQCPDESTSVNSTGCTIPCPECETCPVCGKDEPIDSVSSSEDDISITGSGDTADLITVGGASLLGGIGVSTILSQMGGRNVRIPKSKRDKIELELEFESSDSEPDFLMICSDCGKNVSTLITSKKSKYQRSDGIWDSCPACGPKGQGSGRLILQDNR